MTLKLWIFLQGIDAQHPLDKMPNKLPLSNWELKAEENSKSEELEELTQCTFEMMLFWRSSTSTCSTPSTFDFKNSNRIKKSRRSRKSGKPLIASI